VIGTFTPGGTTYTAFTAGFTVAAGNHTVTFVGTDPNGGDNTPFLDPLQILPQKHKPAPPPAPPRKRSAPVPCPAPRSSSRSAPLAAAAGAAGASSPSGRRSGDAHDQATRREPSSAQRLTRWRSPRLSSRAAARWRAADCRRGSARPSSPS